MQLFERAVSQFVKDEQWVMDLHSVLETLADEKVEDCLLYTSPSPRDS